MHTVTGQMQISIFIALLFFQNYVACEENTKNSLYSEFKLDFEIAFEGNLSTVRSHHKHVVCIVNAWSYWRPGKGHYDFTGDHFDGNLCTHIVYRSIHLNKETYGLKLKDEHLDMTIGYIRKMTQLKKSFPHLKTIMSIGGHNEGASTFSAIAATKSKRQLFIRNATESTKKFGFDGLMLDWQYPKFNDKQHFTMLAMELKAECQKMNLILATTLSGDGETVDLGYEIGKINKIFDLILIMSFDYSGPWDKRTGFNAPLKYKKGSSNTVEATLQYLLEKGADPNVLVLGVPLYGRPYLLESKDFSNPAKLGLDSSNGFMGPWTNQDDMLGYHEICGSYLLKNTNGDNVWKAYWDSNALVPFATNGSHWISFDNPFSIFGKVLVATSNKFGLSGIMAWSIDTDDFLGLCSHVTYSLLRTINYALWIGTTNELVSKSLICSLYNTKGNLTIPSQDQLKPRIISEIENISVPLNSDEPIECIAEGKPPPEIIWLKSERKETRIKTSVEEIDIVKDLSAYGAGSLCGPYKSGSTFTLKNFTVKQAGNYICVAKNIFGEKRIEFGISLEKYILKTEEDDYSQMPIGWGWIAGIFIALINITAIVYYLKQKFSKDDPGLTSKEIKEFMEGENYRTRKNGNHGPEIPDEAPYNMSYEIFTNDYETDEDRLLGSGAFGIVFMGRVKGDDVAVKSIKQGAEKHYLKSLMTELKVLIHLEKHPHIVNLVGASTIRLNTGLLYIFVEYCPLGNLQVYLRQCRGSLINLIQNDKIEPSLESLYQAKEDMITTKDLLNWSCQISKALEHLSLKKVIHGDLAARNILLYKRDLIKLTDFGLSRKLYDYANYVKTNQEPLPWRWMSIESLRDLTFSAQSDIWSFGITLFEIFSLGETPYSGISWTTDFVDKLSQQNLRIHHPRYCTTSIYDFLCQCWRENPQDRPKAEDLRLYFETILTESFSEDYTDVKLDRYVNVS